jgi:hypothetical protein
VTVAFGYGVRTVVQLLYGHYYLFIKEFYWRWMLYLITCPLLDIPNILYVFYVHFKIFKSQSVEPESVLEIESSFHSETEESQMELLRFNIAMNFHELQANDAVFNYEYTRVQKELNKITNLKGTNHISVYVSSEDYYPQLEIETANEMAFSHKMLNRVSLNI